MEQSKSRVLEGRIRELERALDIEKRQNIEYQRTLYKKDRRIKELMTEAEEFKQKFKDLQKTVGDLESEVRIHKRRFEESQEICTLNQNRFRKVHQMYLNECGRTEQFEEKSRQKKALEQRTNLFVQA